MSLYSERLATLKREISYIEQAKRKGGNRKKSKLFKKHQKEMIEFIHGRINRVELIVSGKVIVLEKGDSKKGFKHILEKHYKHNDLEAMDILNLPVMFKHAIQLSEEGVSNGYLTVYRRLENQKEHKLITDENRNDKLVVSTYRKT